MITSQTHQPVGAPTAYPVHTTGSGVNQTSYQTTVGAPGMPMPYSDNSTPYPAGPPMMGGAPYPTGAPMAGVPYPPAPYGQPQGMYPPASSPYPPQAAPYPPQQEMNPPTYTDVVGNQTYQKQAPYNPNYTA